MLALQALPHGKTFTVFAHLTEDSAVKDFRIRKSFSALSLKGELTCPAMLLSNFLTAVIFVSLEIYGNNGSFG